MPNHKEKEGDCPLCYKNPTMYKDGKCTCKCHKREKEGWEIGIGNKHNYIVQIIAAAGDHGDVTLSNEKSAEIQAIVDEVIQRERKVWQEEVKEAVRGMTSVCGRCKAKGVNTNGECECSYEDSGLILKKDTINLPMLNK